MGVGMITKREAAIISAYTGYKLGELEDVQKYAEELFGNPKWANDYPDKDIMEKLQDKAKADFEALKVGASKKKINK
jgi:hypothetical protein